MHSTETRVNTGDGIEDIKIQSKQTKTIKSQQHERQEVPVSNSDTMLIVGPFDDFYISELVPMEYLRAIDLPAITRSFIHDERFGEGCPIFWKDQLVLEKNAKQSMEPLLTFVSALVMTNPAVYIHSYGIICRPPGCPQQAIHSDGMAYCLHVPISKSNIRPTVKYTKTSTFRKAQVEVDTKKYWACGEICVLGGGRCHAGPTNETTTTIFIAYFHCASRKAG